MDFNVIQRFFDSVISQYSISPYLLVGTITLVVVIICGIIRSLLLRLVHKLPDSQGVHVFIEVIKVLSWPLYVIFGLFISSQFFPDLPPKVQDGLDFTTLSVTILYICLIAQKALHLGISYIITNRLLSDEVGEDQYDPTVFKFVEFVAGLLIWATAIVFILQNRNVRVDALVGGLGVAGIAFAFALQNILGDLFASVSIYTDKPFNIGDHIQIGDDIGEVLKIGLKTTRIKTLDGEEMIISNRDLSNSRIKNLSRTGRRKVRMEIVLDKKYPKKKLEKVPDFLKEIIVQIPKTKYYSAYLKEVKDDAFVYELEYDIMKMSYKEFLSVQNAVNLDILETFKVGSVDFKVL
jgi:small-conductance mechanosensitive channel